MSDVSNKALKSKVFSGIIWSFGERFLAQIVSFVVSVVLARFLLPEEYGIVSMVLVFINLANVFVSNGFGESLIQKKDADELDFSTVFCCSLGVSIALYVLLYVAAPLIAQYYRMPVLTVVLRVLAIKIPISSISTIQHAYVSRHMMFRKFFYSTLFGTLFSGLLGIFMAIRGFGIWALVAQYLSNTVIDTIVLFFTVSWRPHFKYSKEKARLLIGFGWKLTAASLLNRVYVELRSLIIGRKYSAADLAFYNRGDHLPSLIITNLNTAISTVLFPAMSNYSDDKVKLKEVSRRSMSLTAYIVFPLLCGLMVVSSNLVELLLTEKWLPCVPYLWMSCIFFMCQPIQTTNWQIIKAVGRGDLCLQLEMFKKVIGISMILLSMNFGVMALAISNALFGIISMFVNMIPNGRLIGYTLKEQLADFMPSLLLSAIMAALVWCIGRIEMNILLLLLIQVVAGGIIYVAGSLITRNKNFTYFISIIRQAKEKSEK